MVAVMCGVALLLWYTVKGSGDNSEDKAEAVAARTLLELRGVLSEYALTSGGTYPATLDSLGSRVVQPVQATREAEYELVYTPKPPARDGAIRGFTLQARMEKAAYRNFYIDESGVLRATEEYRQATAQDPPY